MSSVTALNYRKAVRESMKKVIGHLGSREGGGRVGVPDGPRGAEHRIYSGSAGRTDRRARWFLLVELLRADSSETESRTPS